MFLKTRGNTINKYLLNSILFLLTSVPGDVCVSDEKCPIHIAEEDYSKFWLGFSLKELAQRGVQFQ
jgi:hypothetical protein